MERKCSFSVQTELEAVNPDQTFTNGSVVATSFGYFVYLQAWFAHPGSFRKTDSLWVREIICGGGKKRKVDNGRFKTFQQKVKFKTSDTGQKTQNYSS